MHYLLTELFDLQELRSLFDDLHAMTGITVSLIDTTGAVQISSCRPQLCDAFFDIVSDTGLQSACSQFRVTAMQGDQSADGGYCGCSHCPHGLESVLRPITIRGERLGALLVGKVFCDAPDLDFFRQKSVEFAFDQQSILQAVAGVPVIPGQRFEQSVRLIESLAITLARQGADRLDALHNEEQALHWQQVFEQADFGMSYTDVASNRIVSVNPAYARMHGYSPDELVGRSVLSLYPPESQEQLQGWLQSLLTTGHLVYEAHKLRRDGSLFPARVDLTLVRDETGQARSMIGNCIDLTDRQKHAERSILDVRRQKAKLRLYAMDYVHSDELLQRAVDEAAGLTDSACAAMFYCDERAGQLSLAAITDSWRNGNGAIPFPAVCPFDQAGLWCEPVRQRRVVVHEGTEPDSCHLLRLLGVPVIRDGQVVVLILVADSRTGYTRNDQHQLQLFADGVWNMLARCKAEEELRMAMALTEESLCLKTNLLANLSHELRTPLNGIIGGSQLLAMTDLTQEQRDYLDMIDISVGNELALIDNLLELARMDSSGIQIEHKPFSPCRCAEEVIRVHEQALRAKGLKFSFKSVVDGICEVVGDEARIRQILFLLVGNAVKFTEQGEITVRLVLTEDAEKGLLLRYMVRDTGIGIEQERLEQIFELFTQSDMSSTRRYGGLGLGLKICQRLINAMNGRIWATSTPGNGSTFYCELPVGRISSAAVASEQPLTVLFVEDEFFSAMISTAMLRKMGHTVVMAANGREAVEKWQDQHVDLVLMDIQMPVMSGLEAVQEIRRLEKEQGRSHTLVVAQTAYNPSKYRELNMASSFDGYIAKPLQYKELVALIDDFCTYSESKEVRWKS